MPRVDAGDAADRPGGLRGGQLGLGKLRLPDLPGQLVRQLGRRGLAQQPPLGQEQQLACHILQDVYKRQS